VTGLDEPVGRQQLAELDEGTVAELYLTTSPISAGEPDTPCY